MTCLSERARSADSRALRFEASLSLSHTHPRARARAPSLALLHTHKLTLSLSLALSRSLSLSLSLSDLFERARKVGRFEGASFQRVLRARPLLLLPAR